MYYEEFDFLVFLTEIVILLFLHLLMMLFDVVVESSS